MLYKCTAYKYQQSQSPKLLKKKKSLCEATTAFKGSCYLSQMQISSFYLQSTLCILINSQNIFQNGYCYLSPTDRQIETQRMENIIIMQ